MRCKAAAGVAADAQAEQLVLVQKCLAWVAAALRPSGVLFSLRRALFLSTHSLLRSRDRVAWRARSVHAADRQRDHAHHHRACPSPALKRPTRPPPTSDSSGRASCCCCNSPRCSHMRLLCTVWHPTAAHECPKHRPAGTDVLLAAPAPSHARAHGGPAPALPVPTETARARRAWMPARARRSTRSSCTGPRSTPSTRGTFRRSWVTSSPASAASFPM